MPAKIYFTQPINISIQAGDTVYRSGNPTDGIITTPALVGEVLQVSAHGNFIIVSSNGLMVDDGYFLFSKNK